MLCNVQKRNKSHKNSLTMNRYANIIMPWKPPEGRRTKWEQEREHGSYEKDIGICNGSGSDVGPGGLRRFGRIRSGKLGGGQRVRVLRGIRPGLSRRDVRCGGDSGKGVLTMMTATGFPPFEYLGEDGKPAGVDIDLAQLVADELGVELEVLDMDFNLLIESLKSGKGQLIAAGMTATPERAEQIDFSITYTLNGLILLVPKGSDIKTADDLAGKNIAVQESTTAHIYAQEELGIEPLAFKNANECATAVMGGKADAAILDKVPAQTLAMANPDALETVEQLLTEEEMAMGVAKGNEDLLEVVNSVLQKAMDDGTVESLTDKHLKICAEG